MSRKGKYTQPVNKTNKQVPATPLARTTGKTEPPVIQKPMVSATKTLANTSATMPASVKYSGLPSELRRVAVITGFILIIMVVLWLILK
jgi:hypothetical protein